MTCRELNDFLMSYVDGELPAEQRAAFDEHLAACADCVTYLRSYVDTIALGRAACADPGAPVGTDVPEDLVAAVLAARRRAR